MVTFSTKGSGVCNYTFVMNYPCGYPNHVAVHENDAAEVAFAHDGNDGNLLEGRTPEIETKVGCFVAVKFTNIQSKIYDINWLSGTGTRVSGSMLPHDGQIGDADFTCVFQITSVSEDNKIQLQLLSSDNTHSSHKAINSNMINMNTIG